MIPNPRKKKARKDEQSAPDAAITSKKKRVRTVLAPGIPPVVLSGLEYELPEDLDPRDRKYLTDIGEELKRSGMAGRLDSLSFHILIGIVSDYRKQLNIVKQTEMFVVMPSKQRVFSPEMRLLRDTRERLIYLLAEFGLSPGARSKVRVVYDEEELPARHPKATRRGVPTAEGQALLRDHISGARKQVISREELDAASGLASAPAKSTEAFARASRKA